MIRRSILMRAMIITVLMLTLAGQSFAGSNPFTDIGNAAGKDEIISLEAQGVIKGTGNGLFAPDAPLTAAQGIQLLVNAFNLNIDHIRFIKEPKASDYFTNAVDTAWYANSFIIITFSGLNLPSDLQPGEKWTREEFTHYLVQVMEKQGNLPMINLVPAEIADGDRIEVMYSGSIQRALHYKLVQLDADGKFHPAEQITREEAAVQVYNALEYLKAHPAPAVL